MSHRRTERITWDETEEEEGGGDCRKRQMERPGCQTTQIKCKLTMKEIAEII
jgi:hypothetical protein